MVQQELQELALEPTVFKELSYEVVQKAYALAHQNELPGVATMFLSARIAKNETVDEAFLGVRTTSGQFSPRVVHGGILMGWYRGSQDRPAAVAYDLNVSRFERQDLATD